MSTFIYVYSDEYTYVYLCPYVCACVTLSPIPHVDSSSHSSLLLVLRLTSSEGPVLSLPLPPPPSVQGSSEGSHPGPYTTRPPGRPRFLFRMCRSTPSCPYTFPIPETCVPGPLFPLERAPLDSRLPPYESLSTGPTSGTKTGAVSLSFPRPPTPVTGARHESLFLERDPEDVCRHRVEEGVGDQR